MLSKYVFHQSIWQHLSINVDDYYNFYQCSKSNNNRSPLSYSSTAKTSENAVCLNTCTKQSKQQARCPSHQLAISPVTSDICSDCYILQKINNRTLNT